MMWLMGDIAYDAICSMGCPGWVTVGGAYTGSIWNNGVKVFGLCINEVKLLGLQDGLLLCLGTFRGDVLGYRWKQGFQEPVQEYPIIKLDLTHSATLPPLVDVVSDVGHSVMAAR